ncbi:MAG: archease [Caulobacteraceae bacterium]
MKGPSHRRSRTAWETFPHGADVGVRGYGDSVAEAFANAALALTSVITNPALVRPLRRIEVHCAGADREILFVDWLNQLIARMAVEQMLFGRFEVEIERDALTAEAYGEPIDRARHAPAAEAKGATFTELNVAQDPAGRWRAQCVVDV